MEDFLVVWIVCIPLSWTGRDLKRIASYKTSKYMEFVPIFILES